MPSHLSCRLRALALTAVAAWAASLPGERAAAREMPFLAPYAAGTAFGVTSLAAADFDADGDVDLAMIGATNDEVFWLEDTGAGFAQHLVTDVLDGPHGLEAADVDCDGDVDLVIGETGTDSIVWARNVNDATSWNAGGSITTAVPSLTDFAVGDVTGNGSMDVVAGMSANGGIVALRRTSCSSPIWLLSAVASGTSIVTGVELADIDGDGRLDVASTDSGTGDVAWWQNPGTAGSWTSHLVDGGFGSAQSVSTGDVDGDGDIDLAAAATTDEELAWWANGGDGTSWTKISIGALPSARLARLGDIDGDGDLDLVGGTNVEGEDLFWWDNLGSGLAWDAHLLDPVPDVPQDLLIVDLGADGDADVVTAALLAGEARVFENHPTSRSGVLPASLFNNAYPFPLREIADLDYGDIDGDGDLDLVVAERELALPEGIVYWLENGGLDSAGQLALGGPHFIHMETLNSVESLAVGDIDGDGDADVFIGNTLTLARNGVFCGNDGDGTWSCSAVISTGLAETMDALTIADIDVDGDLDLVSSMDELAGASTTTWWENDGAPTTPAGWIRHDLGASDRRDRLDAVDLDGDGDLDVVESRNIWWRKTPGGWVQASIPGSAIADFVVADVDMDGDPDLAARIDTVSGPGLAWFENDLASGPGNWIEHEVRAPETVVLAGWQIAVADLDVDGDPDLLANLSEGAIPRVVSFENRVRQGEVWLEQTVGPEGSLGARLLTADFDRDGDPDLVGAEESAQIESWINGGGQFALGGATVAPPAVWEGAEREMLEIELHHRGRTGEAALRFTHIALLFEEAPGVPLDDIQIGGLVEGIRLYLDDGSLGFEPGADAEVASLPAPVVTDGLSVLDLPVGVTGLELAAGAASRTYFLTLELTSDATAAGLGTLRLTHAPLAGSGAENLDYGTPLRLETSGDVTAEIFIEPAPLFADAFESGDTSVWGAVVP